MNLTVTIDQALNHPAESVLVLVCNENIARFQYSRLKSAFLKWWNVLKREGVLTITTSDETDNIVELLLDTGFAHIAIKDVGKWRRMIRCRKADYFDDRRLSWDITIYPNETVLEVGPGNFPFPYATRYFDVSDGFKRELKAPLDIGTVENLPYEDKSFDVIVASHILEHTDNPDVAVSELQRVGKRGIIECPHVAKDFILQEGHVHSKWQVLKTGNQLVFVQLTLDQLKYLNDETMRNQMFRLTQYPGIDNSYINFCLRQAFWRCNAFLNPMVTWETTRKAECIVVR